MSRELIQTNLPGYIGPLAVDVTKLTDALIGSRLCGAALKLLADTFVPPARVYRPTTEDNYPWFWAIEFPIGQQGAIVVAFPWAQDWANKDGAQADRSVAVYAKGSATLDQAKNIVDAIQHFFT